MVVKRHEYIYFIILVFIAYMITSCGNKCDSSNQLRNTALDMDSVGLKGYTIFIKTFKIDSIENVQARNQYIRKLDSLNLSLLKVDSSFNIIWESQIRLDAFMNRSYEERRARIEDKIRMIDYDLGGEYGFLLFLKSNYDTVGMPKRIADLNSKFKRSFVTNPYSEEVSIVYSLFLNDFYSKEKSLCFIDSVIDLYPDETDILRNTRQTIIDDLN